MESEKTKNRKLKLDLDRLEKFTTMSNKGIRLFDVNGNELPKK